MRFTLHHSLGPSVIAVLLAACSSSSGSGFGNPGTDSGPGGGGDGSNPFPPGDGGDSFGDGGKGHDTGLPDGDVTVTTTIYANTDDTLYSMDPQSKAITVIGKF